MTGQGISGHDTPRATNTRQITSYLQCTIARLDHAPVAHCAARPSTTANESQPQVTASMASARNARLPIFSATAILSVAKYRIAGIATNAIMKPGHENSASRAVHRL